MKLFLITLGLALFITLVSVLGLIIGRLVTGKDRWGCKRCGTPEKECTVCKKEKKED